MRRIPSPGRIRVLVALLPLLLTSLWVAPAGAAVRPQQPARPAAQEDPLRFARSLYTDGLYDLAAEQLRVQIERGLTPALEEEARWLLPQALEGAGRPAEAAAAFLDFAHRRGSSALAPQGWLRAGDLYARLGRAADAASAFAGFLDLYTESDQRPRATAGLVTALLEEGHTDEALARVSEARRIFRYHPLQPRFALLEARARGREGRPEEALSLTAEVLGGEGSADLKAEAAILQARLQADAGRPAEAAATARAALAATPPPERVAPLRAALGRALVASGEPIAGLPELSAAVSLLTGPERGEASAWLARGYTAAGRPDSALAAWDLALGPAAGGEVTAWGIEAARLALQRGDPARALGWADRALAAEESGRRVEAVELATRALQELDRTPEAVERWRGVLSDPGLEAGPRAQAAMALGDLYRTDLADPAGAVGYYRLAAAAAASGDVWASALWASAEVLAAQGSWISAVAELQPLVGQAGGWGERASARVSFWRTYRLVDVQEGLRRLQAALMALASGSADGRTEALLEIARANAGPLKDFETAVTAFDRYLAAVPSGPRAAQARLEQGRALEALAVIAGQEGRSEAARDARRRASDAYRGAVSVGGESEPSEEAQLALIELDLLGLEGQPVLYYQAMSDRYREFLEHFTSSRRYDQVLLRIGEAAEGLGRYADPSYYDEAASAYRLLLEGERPAAVRTRARLGLGRSLYGLQDWAGAGVLLEQALADLPPGTARDEVLFLAGDARMKRGEGEAAVAHFQELQTRFPESPWTARSAESTGELLLAQGRPQEAVASFRRFLAGAPATEQGRVRYRLAVVLTLLEHPEEAAVEARGAAQDSLIDESLREDALRLWGEQAGAAGRPEQTREAWGILWARAPESEATRAILPELGELLSDSGELERAEQVWRSLAARTENDSLKVRAEAELVYLAWASGRLAEGERRRDEFERTHRREREVLDRYRPLFWAVEGQARLRAEQPDQAEKAFQEILDQAAGSRYAPGALYGLGAIAAGREKTEEAQQRFEELVGRFPDQPEANRARFDLGQLAYLKADYERAVPLFRQVAAGPDPVLAEAAQHNLVLVLERMEAWESAQQEAIGWLERWPDSEDVFDMQVRLGRLYRDGGQPGRAAAYFRTLHAPDSEAAARLGYQLAETLFVLGDYQQAVIEYLKVAYLNEDQFLFAVTARLRAADSYALLGEKERALELYRDIIQRYGATSEYGRTAQVHLENVQAGRAPGAQPPP
jgi:tetratricopeptide (TPR) repeat protein